MATPGSSTDRVLGILDLFTEATPLWTAEAMMDRLGATRSTLYRHLRALTETGFLLPVGGAFTLGPRIIALDRQIRVTDPLLRVAPAVMAAQRDAVAGTQLLCRFFGTSVLSIHEERSDPRIRTSFDRGRTFPLFRGAASRSILANLPQAELRRLFLTHAAEIAAAGQGRSWPEFRDGMKAIRTRGVAIVSDIDPEVIGAAAPIFAAPGLVTGSLVLARLKREVTDRDLDHLAALAREATSRISAALQAGVETAPQAGARSPARSSRGSTSCTKKGISFR